ncbi:hypothetical protein DFH06DRAFT_1307683 [Mycena polygramma]|nr:hypothetical protein DFH06DRAFT_1307683 [Mycena polygramma]
MSECKAQRDFCMTSMNLSLVSCSARCRGWTHRSRLQLRATKNYSGKSRIEEQVCSAKAAPSKKILNWMDALTRFRSQSLGEDIVYSGVSPQGEKIGVDFIADSQVRIAPPQTRVPTMRAKIRTLDVVELSAAGRRSLGNIFPSSEMRVESLRCPSAFAARMFESTKVRSDVKSQEERFGIDGLASQTTRRARGGCQRGGGASPRPTSEDRRRLTAESPRKADGYSQPTMQVLRHCLLGILIPQLLDCPDRLGFLHPVVRHTQAPQTVQFPQFGTSSHFEGFLQHAQDTIVDLNSSPSLPYLFPSGCATTPRIRAVVKLPRSKCWLLWLDCNFNKASCRSNLSNYVLALSSFPTFRDNSSVITPLVAKPAELDSFGATWIIRTRSESAISHLQFTGTAPLTKLNHTFGPHQFGQTTWPYAGFYQPPLHLMHSFHEEGFFHFVSQRIAFKLRNRYLSEREFNPGGRPILLASWSCSARSRIQSATTTFDSQFTSHVPEATNASTSGKSSTPEMLVIAISPSVVLDLIAAAAALFNAGFGHLGG